MRTHCSQFVLIPALTLASLLSAQPSRETVQSKGRAALAAGQYEQAGSSLREGAAAAKSREERGTSAFYLGLLEQTQAQNSEGETAQAHWGAAARLYRQAADQLPESAGARNNLAQSLAATGDARGAERAFREAIALNDPRSPLYLVNYGRFLEEQGQWTRAAQQYRSALRLDPEQADAPRLLIDLYAREAPADAADYLWGALEDGYAVRARDGALDLLERADLRPSQVDELMATIAGCLTLWNRPPSAFFDTEAARRLQALAGRPLSGPAAEQLLKVHRAPGTPGDYGWWAERGNPYEEPERGVWPRSAFQQLARSIGRRHELEGELQEAEAYFKLAASLVREDPDPKAVLDLADLYARQEGGLAKLEQAAEQYISPLYAMKGQAYRRSKQESIREYHLALGTIYSHLTELPPEQSRGNANQLAVYHLQRARDTGAELNVQPEPEQLQMLAASYERDGRQRDADLVRLEAAQNLQPEADPDRRKGLPPLFPTNDLASTDAKWQGWFNTGADALKTGQIESAVAAFGKATQLNPQASAAWGGLGQAQMEAASKASGDMAIRHWTMSADAWGNAAKQDPQKAEYLLYHGLALVNSGSHQEGISRLQTAARVDPDQQLISNQYIGAAWLNAGDPDRAAQAYRSVIAADPSNHAARLLFARAAAGSSDPQLMQEAIRTLAEYLERYPNGEGATEVAALKSTLEARRVSPAMLRNIEASAQQQIIRVR